MAVTMSQLGETPCVTLSNDAVDVEVLAGKGADILSITDRATGVNPLWRSRWGHHQLRTAQMSADTTTAWLVSCVGGWNFLFPGGGAESVVQGGLQPMHGEASITSWDVVDHDGVDSAGPWVRLSTHLSRSPFTLERTVRLVGESGELEVIDRAVNEGGEPFPTAWTQHPTLGPPFLDASCVIETNAATIEPDDRSTIVAVSTLSDGISETAWLVSNSSGAPMPETKLEPISTSSTTMAIQKIGPRRSFFTFTASRYYGEPTASSAAVAEGLRPRRRGPDARPGQRQL